MTFITISPILFFMAENRTKSVMTTGDLFTRLDHLDPGIVLSDYHEGLAALPFTGDVIGAVFQSAVASIENTYATPLLRQVALSKLLGVASLLEPKRRHISSDAGFQQITPDRMQEHALAEIGRGFVHIGDILGAEEITRRLDKIRALPETTFDFYSELAVKRAELFDVNRDHDVQLLLLINDVNKMEHGLNEANLSFAEDAYRMMVRGLVYRGLSPDDGILRRLRTASGQDDMIEIALEEKRMREAETELSDTA